MTNIHKKTIAIDAMGGDHAPKVVIEGLNHILATRTGFYFLLFGDESMISPLVKSTIPTALQSYISIHHCDEVIGDEDKASQAVRRGWKSSMGKAIQSVKDGDADAVISAGNTGALMAMALFSLKTMQDIDRPAICSSFPTLEGHACMLDLGANIECKAHNLVEFAMMGDAFARTVMGVENPRIGLLNIGVEAIKGHSEIKRASEALESSPLGKHYKGFVEGDGICKGVVDVIVADGFTGNVALKSMEGAAKLIFNKLKQGFLSSFLAKLGYLLAKTSLKKINDALDPRHHNGAVLLGLNGIVVKSHGGTDAIGYAHALIVAMDMIDNNFYERFREDIESMREDTFPLTVS